MKININRIVHLLFLLLIFLFVLPAPVLAQDCNNSYYQMKEGSSFTLTNYDAKNKATGKITHTYTNVTKTGNGVTARVKQEIFDQNGKSVSGGEYDITCKDGVITLNMHDMMGSGIGNMKDANMKMEMSGDAMELPSNLQVGQTLKDITMTMKAMMGQTKVMEQQMKIKNRKVESKETVTTPAGKFDSFKLSEETEMSGIMGKPMTMKTVVWYAKGPGMVKSESYDAKGKLTGYTLLTAYSK